MRRQMEYIAEYNESFRLLVSERLTKYGTAAEADAVAGKWCTYSEMFIAKFL